MDSSESASCWPLNSTGLTGVVILMRTNGFGYGGQTLLQVGRVECHGDVVAIHVDVQCSVG